MADKAAVAKVNKLTGSAGKIGNEPEQDAEQLSWSERIRMDYASDAEIREEYDGKSLENLAIIAQWESAVGDRALAQINWQGVHARCESENNGLRLSPSSFLQLGAPALPWTNPRR